MHDKMTEQRYLKPIETFRLPPRKEDWFEIDVLGQGERALKEVSEKLGLAFDDWDIQYYCEMFRDKLRRNPTSVECFDLAQSNSEHSRHWFFKVSFPSLFSITLSHLELSILSISSSNLISKCLLIIFLFR